ARVPVERLRRLRRRAGLDRRGARRARAHGRGGGAQGARVRHSGHRGGPHRLRARGPGAMSSLASRYRQIASLAPGRALAIGILLLVLLGAVRADTLEQFAAYLVVLAAAVLPSAV